MTERELISEAIILIRTWHGIGMGKKEEKKMWDIYYNQSPEMKPFREYFESFPIETNPYLLRFINWKRIKKSIEREIIK